ncbi:IS66 family insertion sequence element accessory protein TnpA [Cupriavidus necator]
MRLAIAIQFGVRFAQLCLEFPQLLVELQIVPHATLDTSGFPECDVCRCNGVLPAAPIRRDLSPAAGLAVARCHSFICPRNQMGCLGRQRCFAADLTKDRYCQLPAFLRDLLAQWRNSGGSVRAFCRQHGLAVSTFGLWRKRLNHERRRWRRQWH